MDIFKSLGFLCSIGMLAFTLSSGAAEYFVGKPGDDANNGQTKDKPFLTIQKGLNALKPGDILTIGPGEYAECVKLEKFGSPDKETLIRAEIPGTVLLRGDRNADLKFKQVNGRRFVYVADYDQEVLSLNEVDTLTTLASAGDADTLEFSPGKYYRDAAEKKLYVSSSDFQAPDRHRYTIGNLKDHGFTLRETERVVIDGLAASGYLSAASAGLLFPSSGFLLHNTKSSIIRRCTAFFNGSGIVMNSDKTGQNNTVTDCQAYGNGLDGIVGYNPCSETIRDSRMFLNRTYGARYYGGRREDKTCLMSNLLSWGHPGGDYWMKGSGLSGIDKFAFAERCIALKDICNIGILKHCMKGGGFGGDSPDTITLPPGTAEFYQFTDREFADPMNFDFHLQATSQFRQPGKDYDYKGPFPFEPNIYYVKTNGNDQLDGLSMNNAWSSLARAFKNLKPGDTLYIAGGRYANSTPITAKQVKIRGRGIDTIVIEGDFQIVGSEDVLFERINFTGAVRIEKGTTITFNNCFFPKDKPVAAVEVKGLNMTHGVFNAPVKLQKCSKVFLSGNIYAASPAVQADALDNIISSSYNSYLKTDNCWEIGGKALSMELLQKSHDTQSMVLAPDLSESNGAATIKNAFQFAGRGPLASAIGPYREWQPRSMQLIGPFVNSASDTTANIEWWTTLPTEVELCWGDTPDCKNKIPIVQNSFYSYSLTGLEPGRKFYVKIKPTKLKDNSDPARRFKLSESNWSTAEFTTAKKADTTPQTYYVSNDGNNGQDGLSRETAWKTLQYAADHVRPGDTVLLAGGKYPGTVYFRVTGEKNKPITFKAIPGEKAIVDGLKETLKVGLVLYNKHYYNFDSLYIQEFAGIEDNVAGAENGALLGIGGSNLQVTRCHFSGGWGPAITVNRCGDMLVRNCVFMHSMGSAWFTHCPKLRIENNVFISPLIQHLTVSNDPNEPALVANNVFSENTRGKAQICFVGLSPSVQESNNCFYVRWPENERQVMNYLTLPEHRAVRQTNSFAANPQMPGAPGWKQGWGPGAGDFNGLFATNPEVVKRGIGLQPEAFRDFHFKLTDWPYTLAWADKALAARKAAEALVKSGKDAEALAAYTNMVSNIPMGDRLKTDLLDQAALCANRLKQYDQAMTLAKQIPLKPFSVRRQMAIMLEQQKYTELLATFSDKAMGGFSFHLSWHYPELEDVMADLFYYRSIAFIQTNDLKSAEADLKTMVDKRNTLQYSPGEAIHELALLRLGDFYRMQLKDDKRAMEIYNSIIDRTMQAPYRLNIINKPAFTGGTESLAAATKAASEILRKQGKEGEAIKLQISLLKAQAEAFADIGKKAEMMAKFKEVLACKGVFPADKEPYEKRIGALQGDTLANLLKKICAESSLFEGTQRLLIASASDPNADVRKTALRAIIAYAPVDKINPLLAKAEDEAKSKAATAKPASPPAKPQTKKR